MAIFSKFYTGGAYQTFWHKNYYKYLLLTQKIQIMAKYSKGAGKKVEKVMHEMHEGKLKSGKSNKKVTNPQTSDCYRAFRSKEGRR